MAMSAAPAPIASPTQDEAVDGSDRTKWESANVVERNRSIPRSTPGIWIRPPMSARTASTPMATFIGISRSAM